jgi:xylose isomerase
MDAFARGLKIAARVRADGVLRDFVKKRYAAWDAELGQKIEKGQVGFEDLESYMLQKGNPERNTSGRQEMLEGILNRYFDVV